jgi:primosomal protein N' (replication factor Y)
MLDFNQTTDFQEKETFFADVILPVPIPGTFTYRLPFALNGMPAAGMRVVVPFGKRVQTGIVLRIHQRPPEKHQAKYILELLDDKPTVNTQQLRLWEWAADYYMCSLGEMMIAALPSGLKISSLSRIQIHPDFALRLEEETPEALGLNDKETRLLQALHQNDNLTFSEAAEILDLQNIYTILKSLIAKQAIIIFEEIQEKYKPKTLKKLRLAAQFLTAETLADLLQDLDKRPKQQEAVLKYISALPLHLSPEAHRNGLPKSIFTEAGISDSALKTLLKNGIFEEFSAIVPRFADQDTGVLATVTLSPTQAKACADIEQLFTQKDTVLLHGITGSGKTEMYIHLISRVLESGSQVLFLLPEIALTAQIVERLRKVFGKQLGVYHSKFSDNERVEIWKGVAEGRFSVVVGARSAVWLPFSHLGLVVVDEEHEGAYKQFEPAPRYNARDLSMVLASLFRAKVLLGSATPSLESYYLAKQGRYGLVEALQRYGSASLPEIRMVDTRLEKKQKTMKGTFSSVMLQEMQRSLDKHEQIILFQNRRGYAPHLSCDDCGTIPQCTNCSVSLTYHLYSKELRCHYCGYREDPPTNCRVCGSDQIKHVGFGTEKIEDELNLYLPTAVVQRMDLDTTRTRTGHQDIIRDFADKKTDVLVGTQMVSKGLDFDNVRLVGVFDVDRMLYFPDFRSHERTFQLVTQVSGRAGRRETVGLVLIQTGNPQHPILQHIAEHDYHTFYQNEIVERERYGYPPFTRMIRLTSKSEDLQLCVAAAHDLAEKLRRTLGAARVLGPEAPVIEKIRNQYLREVWIKLEREGINLRQTKTFIAQTATEIEKQSKYKSVRIIADVDPA